MSTEAPEILLAHYLKTLKLPTFQREYQKLARLKADKPFGDLIAADAVRFLRRDRIGQAAQGEEATSRRLRQMVEHRCEPPHDPWLTEGPEWSAVQKTCQ
ncbi:hypothetical protein [Rhizobium rhizogenes]|uniref:hypothetical protein n=1 Tax=Rhizobium rhizogenes TaxID=359 RepID=UPI002356F5CD